MVADGAKGGDTPHTVIDVEEVQKARAEAAEEGMSLGTLRAKDEEAHLADEGDEVAVDCCDLYRFASGCERCLIGCGTAGAVITGAAMPAFSFLFGQLVDDLSGSDTNEVADQVSKMAMYLAIVGGALFISSTLQMACFMAAGERTMAKVKSTYFRAILEQEPGWFDKVKVGELTSKLHSDVQVMKGGMGEKMGLMGQHTSTIILSYIVGFITSWRLTLVLMGCLPLIAGGGVLMQMAMVGSTEKKQKAYAKAGGIAEEALANIRTVHSFRAHRKLLGNYVEHIGTARKWGTKAGWLQGATMGFSYFLFFVTEGIGFYYASYLCEWGLNSVGDIVTTYFAVLMGGFSMGAMGEPWAKIASARAAALSVYRVIDRKPVIVSGTKRIPSDQFKGHIRLEHSAFAYPTRVQQTIFQDFAIDIPPSKTTALVGMSGCGKSSLVGIVQRFYDLFGEYYAWESEDGLRNLATPVVARIVAARAAGDATVSVPVSFSDCGHVRGTLEVDFAKEEMRAVGLDGPIRCEDETGHWYAFGPEGKLKSGVKLPNDVSQQLTVHQNKGSGAVVIELAAGRFSVDAGAGTMASVASPLRRCEAEDITVDGVPLKELDLQWWRQQIGFVTQEPVLFTGTVEENVRAGAPDASAADVKKALTDANLAEFATDERLKTQVGEGGSHLSGGQKQRVAIARAIIRHPRVLLLDEATSALDRKSEQEVQRALSQAQRGAAASGLGGEAAPTTLVIAHRLVTVQDADKIVVLRAPRHGGEQRLGTRIVEQASGDAHKELVAAGGHYASLWRMQCAHDPSEGAEGSMQVVSTSHVAKSGASAAPYAGGDDDDAEKKAFPAKLDTGAAVPGAAEEKKKKKKEDKPVYGRIKDLSITSGDDVCSLAVALLGALLNGAVYPFYAICFTKAMNEFTLLATTEGHDRDAITFWCVMYLAVGLGALVGNFLQFGGFAQLGEELTHRLRAQLFEHFLRQDMAFHDRAEHDSGVLSSALSAKTEVIHNLFGPSIGIGFRTLFCLGIGLGIAFYYQWELTLILLCCVPPMVIGGYMNMKIMGGGIEDDDSQESTSRLTSDAIRNFKTVVAFNMAPGMCQKYDSESKPLTTARTKRAVVGGFTFGFSQCQMYCAFALAFWYGGRLIRDGKADFQDVMMVMMEVMMSAMGIGETSAISANSGPDAQEAAREVFDLLDIKPGIDQMSSEGRTLPDVRSVTLKDVCFEYPTRKGFPVLRKLSLTLSVPAPDAATGVSVGLIGTTGCGKSTILQLLQRFYDPGSGRITLQSAGGETAELTDVDLQWWRQELSVVQQEPVLFSDTVETNIKYGKPAATHREVAQSAEVAQIADDVESWPDQWETCVGARGGMLSGGQKQRVAIARAIIGAPSVLLFDEATSALDSKSEREVQGALDAIQSGQAAAGAAALRKMVTVTIAHKLPTIQGCDPICVIDKGAVAEHGSHDELMGIPDGEYRARYNLYHSVDE